LAGDHVESVRFIHIYCDFGCLLDELLTSAGDAGRNSWNRLRMLTWKIFECFFLG
jgi:hypothetical protein